MEMREVKRSEVVLSEDSVPSLGPVERSSFRAKAEPCRLSMSRDIIVTEMLLAAVERQPRRRGCARGVPRGSPKRRERQFEEEELGEILAESFKARAKVIADQAHNPRGALGEGADFLRGLDESERQCKSSFDHLSAS